MLRDMGIITLLAFLIACQPCYAQDPNANSQANVSDSAIEADRIFAPSIAEKLYNLAYETGNSPAANNSDIQQAIIFMQATTLLDKQASYVLPDMIKLAAKYPDQSYFNLMTALLNIYVTPSADLQVTQTGIQYQLNQLNSRQDREALLEHLITTIGKKNKWLDSEISSSLGSFMLEKANLDGASFYFMQAYNDNIYNRFAFEKLFQIAGNQIKPSMYMQYLIDCLDQNPLDMNVSLEIGKFAHQQRIYEISSQGYNYACDLYEYLYPSQPLPAWIYLPWSLSAYNSARDQNKCLQIAQKVRQSGTFDLVLESIAAKAAMKMNDPAQAKQLITDAEAKAIQLLQENKVSQPLARQQLAWFYSFIAVDPQKALSNANKAYSLDANSTDAASYLAYALVINNQIDLAKTLIDHNDIPVANLAKAKIMLSQGDKDKAITILKTMIEKNPDLIESEEARKVLAENGSEVVTSPELIAKEFENISKLPVFAKPESYIYVALNVQGNKFTYGSKIDGTITIENRSSRPMVIDDYSLIKGNIRIDAVVKGDIEKRFPELVSMRFRPSSPIKAGQTIVVPVRLVTGQFKQLLDTYPQANLNVDLTAYIDPVISSDGKIENRVAAIKPIALSVSRPGIKIDNRYLQNRLDAMSKGQQGQKILITQLFAGLLREQNAMANRQPLYQFVYADWMPSLLHSAVQHRIEDSDWAVKVSAMIELMNLPLDYRFISSVSENLSDSHWPVRLMAIYLLSKNKNQQFAKVLDYYAQFDTNKFVRDMAVSLGGKAPVKAPVQIREPNSPEEPNKSVEPNSITPQRLTDSNSIPAKLQEPNTPKVPNSIEEPNSAIKPNLLKPNSASQPNSTKEPNLISDLNTIPEPNLTK